MSRRRAAQRREVLPDPKFGDTTLTRFMNCLMYSGKKSVAEGAVYGALDHIQKRTGQDPVKVFHGALDNVRPAVEVRSRRVGGATYQVWSRCARIAARRWRSAGSSRRRAAAPSTR
jgi:small subunit ribosomal protein S7